MSLLDLLSEFDAALDWDLEDPLLADHHPSPNPAGGWGAGASTAAVATD